MTCRRVIAEKHLFVARLLLDGSSGYRARRAAGYSYWSARNFGLVLRHCWALREAIRREEERRSHYLAPHPARRRRHDRRPIAVAIRQYVTPDLQAATTNTFLHKLHAEGIRAHAIAQGQTFLPVRCSICQGLTEGRDYWCPQCQRIET
jgi:hypothetical protein